jgi:hypothetical protein
VKHLNPSCHNGELIDGKDAQPGGSLVFIHNSDPIFWHEKHGVAPCF